MDTNELRKILKRKSISSHDDVWKFWLNKAATKKCPVCQTNVMYKSKHNGEDEVGSWERSHIISDSNGGSENMLNIIPTCRDCNRSGNGKNIDDYMWIKQYDILEFIRWRRSRLTELGIIR